MAAFKHSGLQKDVLNIYRNLLRTVTSAIQKTSSEPRSGSGPLLSLTDDVRKKVNVYSSIRSEFRINKTKIAGNSHAAIEHLVRKGKRSLELVKKLNEGMDGISLPDGEGNKTGRRKWA
ncbi:UNVERIFIED_CONTAM: hypothetical protein HDU68_004518 [Siphonaria sp. JEL0065]|nr:hypothetical protein HDU68_004518 [Siphonaria sp. JEL0065]